MSAQTYDMTLEQIKKWVAEKQSAVLSARRVGKRLVVRVDRPFPELRAFAQPMTSTCNGQRQDMAAASMSSAVFYWNA